MENYLGNPNLKKVNTSQEYTKEQILEYQKCMNDPLYFIKPSTPSGTYFELSFCFF